MSSHAVVVSQSFKVLWLVARSLLCPTRPVSKEHILSPPRCKKARCVSHFWMPSEQRTSGRRWKGCSCVSFERVGHVYTATNFTKHPKASEGGLLASLRTTVSRNGGTEQLVSALLILITDCDQATDRVFSHPGDPWRGLLGPSTPHSVLSRLARPARRITILVLWYLESRLYLIPDPN